MTGIRSSFVLLAVLAVPHSWTGAAAADGPVQGQFELAADQSGAGADSDAAVRKRAEELAGAASERFSQILSEKDEPASEKAGEQDVAGASQDSGEAGVLAPIWNWLAQASKDYQDVIIVKLKDPDSEPVPITAPDAGAKEIAAAPETPAQPEAQPSAAPSEPEAAPSLQWGSITTTIREWLARANRSYRNEIVKRLRTPMEGEPEPAEAPKAVAEEQKPAPTVSEQAPPAEAAPQPAKSQAAGIELPEANPKRVAEAARKVEAEKLRVAEAADAKRKAEAEERRLAEEAAAKRQAEAEAEQKRLAEAEAARKAAAEQQRLAEEAEAKRKAEAERKRLAEEEAQRTAEAEKQRLAAEAEAKRKAEAEKQRLAEAEAARKAAAEQQRLAEEEAQRQAEAEKQRLAAEVEANRKADAEKERLAAAKAETERKADDARASPPERKPAADKPMEVAQAPAATAGAAASVETESSNLTVEDKTPSGAEPAAPPMAERKPAAEAASSAQAVKRQRPRHVTKRHHRKTVAAKTYKRKHVHAYRKKRTVKRVVRRGCACHHRRRCGRVRHYRAAAPGPGSYVVRRGDTLWGIAKRHYGSGAAYRRIYRANRGRIRNPHRIYANQRIFVP